MEKQYCVYCHISPSGKRYIGVTCRKPERRWDNGNGYKENTYFAHSIQKYGWDSFEHLILREGLTQQEASELEKRLILEYDTTNRDKGYNLESGGLYCEKRLSEETRRKISEAHKGKYSEAQRLAAMARRGKGHPHTEEAKRKISAAHKGRKLSEEQKRYLSEINKGKKLRPDIAAKFKTYRMRKVIQCDLDGNEMRAYNSIQEASTNTGVMAQSISNCCRGRVKRAGAYKWKYATPTGGDV